MVYESFISYLNEIDPHSLKYGKITKEDLFEAVRLNPLKHKTWREAEYIYKQISDRPWPSPEEADRTSIYPQLFELLDKAKRPEI